MTPMTQAALLAVASAFMFNLESVVVKAIEGVPMPTIVLARALGQLAWALPAVISDPFGALRTRQPGLAILRGVLSCASWFMYFTAFAAMPLATATVLSFTTVLFVSAMAGPVLGEKVGWRRWSATLLGFAGVVLIVRPGVHPVGLPEAFAVGSALLGAGIVLTTKTLARSERTTTIMLYIGLVTTAVWLPIAAPGLAWPGWWNMLLLLGTATAGPIAMVFWINALRLADASVVAPISYVRLLFAAAFGIALFDEAPDIWLGLGAVLIVASTLYITRREAKLARLRQADAASRAAQAEKPAAESAASSGAGSRPKSE